MPKTSSSQRARRFRRVLVITGDHSLPDRTKWDGRYTDDDLQFHAEMQAALRGLPQYEFDFLSEHERLFERLQADPPDFVFNLCDTGFRNVAAQELHVAALLEVNGVAYSGAPPAGMVLCYDKAVVRLVADALGIEVPNELYVAPGQPLDDLELFYPALIKPVFGDGSVGITRSAWVRTREEAARQLDWLRDQLPGCAALYQEFLPGAEYGLALVGNPQTGFACFPPLEVDYSELPEELPAILAFESKTGPETAYSKVRIRAARLADAPLARLRRNAELLFARLQCRDYARFDFRASADGTIKLLEVNPNPAWSSAAKLAMMAGFAGKSYAELLELILETAQARLAPR